jgi:cysteine synthase A
MGRLMDLAAIPPPLARRWASDAIARLEAAGRASPETPLFEIPQRRAAAGIQLFAKDESAHPSGSLKHRLARSLFLYALCSGRLRPGQGVVDASSGSTAVSEAWFARRLGLPFVAVMPEGTAIAKQREVEAAGGRCELVGPGVDTVAHARALAEATGACFLDQFGLAATATDWRGNNNIGEALLRQCREAGGGDPAWVVCGAGTGGTSGTIGRHLRHAGSDARLCVAEPPGAAFAAGWRTRDRGARASRATCIEGIGRARVEPCFAFELADAVVEVEDTASIAGAWALRHWTRRWVGGSSGTNLVAALRLAAGMRARGERGSIVLLLCDRGDRYADTLFEPAWLQAQGHELGPWLRGLDSEAHGRPAAAPGDACRLAPV